MFCPRCGTEMDETDAFCRHCGHGFAPRSTLPVTPKPPMPANKRWGMALLFAFIVLIVVGLVFQHSQSPTRLADEATPKSAGPMLTPTEAKAAQKALLDTAEVYRKTTAFTRQAEAENLTGICASIVDVKASARQALSSVRKVPTSEATRPLIENLRSGLLDVQSGAQSVQSACETGIPVEGEPLAKMVAGMRTINAFTTDWNPRR
jgi:uncharacterized membrane protein